MSPYDLQDLEACKGLVQALGLRVSYGCFLPLP